MRVIAFPNSGKSSILGSAGARAGTVLAHDVARLLKDSLQIVNKLKDLVRHRFHLKLF